MTFPPKTVSTCVDRLQAAFLIVVQILFTLKIEEFILLTNVDEFYLMRIGLVWSWSRYDRYTTLKHKFSPQTALIVRSQIVAQAQKS